MFTASPEQSLYVLGPGDPPFAVQDALEALSLAEKVAAVPVGSRQSSARSACTEQGGPGAEFEPSNAHPAGRLGAGEFTAGEADLLEPLAGPVVQSREWHGVLGAASPSEIRHDDVR